MSLKTTYVILNKNNKQYFSTSEFTWRAKSFDTLEEAQKINEKIKGTIIKCIYKLMTKTKIMLPENDYIILEKSSKRFLADLPARKVRNSKHFFTLEEAQKYKKKNDVILECTYEPIN